MELTSNDIESAFKAFESLTMDRILDIFADDAVLFDPHYPDPRMVGKKNIFKGIKWGLESLSRTRFFPIKIWIDGHEAAAKVETNHVFKSGEKIHFIQVFIFKVNSEKKFTLIESYSPYKPSV